MTCIASQIRPKSWSTFLQISATLVVIVGPHLILKHPRPTPMHAHGLDVASRRPEAASSPWLLLPSQLSNITLSPLPNFVSYALAHFHKVLELSNFSIESLKS